MVKAALKQRIPAVMLILGAEAEAAQKAKAEADKARADAEAAEAAEGPPLEVGALIETDFGQTPAGTFVEGNVSRARRPRRRSPRYRVSCPAPTHHHRQYACARGQPELRVASGCGLCIQAVAPTRQWIR